MEWYAWHLIEQLKTQSANLKTEEPIQFILYSDTALTGELADLPKNWSVKILAWPPKRLWTQFRLSWEMLFHPPDVLWVPAHVFPLIHPKKTVLTVHDVAARRFPYAYSWWERWYSLWSARFALKHLWKIITPSEFTKSELTSDFRLQTSDKIVVVHHGYDSRCRKFEDESALEAVLKKYNIKRPFIMSVGRLEAKKNTVNIIRAFNQLRGSYKLSAISYQLALIGNPGWGYEQVAEAIVQSAYKHDIRLLGWIPPEDIALILNAAEVFVFPSFYEGFGLPVLEAMACGTPVVAGAGSSLEEVGGDCAVYVDPLNTDEIAKVIERLFTDTACRNSLVAQGLARVKNFSWERAARETLAVLLS